MTRAAVVESDDVRAVVVLLDDQVERAVTFVESCVPDVQWDFGGDVDQLIVCERGGDRVAAFELVHDVRFLWKSNVGAIVSTCLKCGAYVPLSDRYCGRHKPRRRSARLRGGGGALGCAAAAPGSNGSDAPC